MRVLAGALAAGTLAGSPGWGPAVAGAQPRRPCAPPPRKLAPQLLSPCQQATVALGRPVTFVVYDANPRAGRYRPWLDLTPNRPPRGPLKPDQDAVGVYAQMHGVRGHPHHYALTVSPGASSSYWLHHAGTYYVQVAQIDCSVRSCIRYGPIETITTR